MTLGLIILRPAQFKRRFPDLYQGYETMSRDEKKKLDSIARLYPVKARDGVSTGFYNFAFTGWHYDWQEVENND
jgi:hypothetical protein